MLGDYDLHQMRLLWATDGLKIKVVPAPRKFSYELQSRGVVIYGVVSRVAGLEGALVSTGLICCD